MASVNKVQVDGIVYDLGGSGGFSDDAKNALIALLENVAYIGTDGQQYLTDLQNKLFDNYWSITNTLSNASNSNSAQTVEKGASYSATISASAGYTLEGATVSVTMNGADVTSAVYNNGTISISEVTGDVVITVVAVALTVVSISAVYTQSGTVYANSDIDDLKDDLIVTALYNDNSTSIVPSTDYTLSGLLALRTSVITVSVLDKTTTFYVSVTLADFSNGHSIAKANTSSLYPQYAPFAYRSSAAARATTFAPIPNNNYTFTVTDSSKYAINAVDVTSMSQLDIRNDPNAIDKVGYSTGSKTVSWNTTDSVSTGYVWIALKKNDNTAFTAEELSNGAEAVFTYTVN